MLKLVLLPGMDGTGKMFAGFTDALSGNFETVTIEYPAERHVTYRELEELVRGACPASQPHVILAESFSTPLAIKVAATNPPALKGLILCAGFASSPVRGWRRLLALCVAPILFRSPLPDFAAKVWLLGPNAPPSFLLAVREAISSVQARVLTARLSEVLSCDTRAELGRVAVPILYLQANHDRLVSGACLKEIIQIKPQVTVHSIEGPHLLLQSEPHKSATIIAEFVKRLT